MKYVILNTNRNGYSVEQCGRTLTVGELISELEQYDEDMKDYFSNDNGYTYGNIGYETIDVEESEK